MIVASTRIQGLAMKFQLPYAFIACLLFPSCSMKISHSNGTVTYLGAVNIREGNAGSAPFVHSRRYGFMLDAGAHNNGLAVGYDDRLMVKPPNNAITSISYAPGNHDLNYQHQ